MSKIKKQLLAGPYLIWIIGFIILPLFMIVYYAFKGSDGGFTFEYVAAIAQHTNIKALLLSLRLGIICTIICLVLSYPLAMILNGLKIKNQSFVVFVFMLPIYNSMTRIKNDWIEAALDLGANKVTILFKIILPLTVSGVISGIVMVFVPSLTSFAISQILGGGKVLLIGNIIEQDFVHGSQWGAGSGRSLVLMVFVLISMALVNLFDKEGDQSALW